MQLWCEWRGHKGHIVTALRPSVEIAEESLSVCAFQCEGSHNQPLWARGAQGIYSVGIACWQQWPLGTRPRPFLHTGNHIASAGARCDRDSALRGFSASAQIWKGLYFVFILLSRLFLKGSRNSQIINANKSMFCELFFFFPQVNWKIYMERKQDKLVLNAGDLRTWAAHGRVC